MPKIQLYQVVETMICKKQKKDNVYVNTYLFDDFDKAYRYMRGKFCCEFIVSTIKEMKQMFPLGWYNDDNGYLCFEDKKNDTYLECDRVHIGAANKKCQNIYSARIEGVDIFIRSGDYHAVPPKKKRKRGRVS